MEREPGKKQVRRGRECAHERATSISPGVSWCVACGAYRMTRMVTGVDGWRSSWGPWNKPTGKRG